MSCNHMNCCLQNTLHINLHILYNFKNPKIMKIQQVHQKIHTKHFLLFCLNCFLFVIHLNLKQLRLTGEA